MKNILVTSLGASWSIIPELLGFTNPDDYPLYRNHKKNSAITEQRDVFKIQSIDEIWVATTNGNKVKENILLLEVWKLKILERGGKLPEIKLFSYLVLQELDDINEIEPMSDLIYRLVLHAKYATGEGQLYISLAGGRKNMSVDIQNAANIFGCDALLHVMADNEIHSKFKSDNQIEGFINIPGDEVSCFYPLVLNGLIVPSPVLYVEPKIQPSLYPIEKSLRQDKKNDLYRIISKRQTESANSLLNVYKKRTGGDTQTNYTAFHLLNPEVVEKLKADKIGINKANKKKDMEWLKKLPKAELHCHFGGILSPSEIVEVAKENYDKVNKMLGSNPDFKEWIEKINEIVNNNDFSKLPIYNPKENIRKNWQEKGIEEPIAISAFILAFKNNVSLLEKYIYSDVGSFKRIGIEKYEKLGDLQGSSLLQNEAAIRKTCQLLVKQCKNDNIKYCEVRCSPVNYTRGGLKSEEVVSIMMDELKDKQTTFKLLFIASRHTKSDEPIIAHIKLALNMIEHNADFNKMFVGFDLAGAESEKSPEELRNVFIKILEKSIPTTIHAGEDMPVKNIWEAIYHLSAERIGHGLTLNDDGDLKNRLKERKTAIELCPSSNDQIIGYHDYLNPVSEFAGKEYPLKQYLKDGLKVTINTDDPGISLTTLTREYYKAACMCLDGLSKWEILQINRNGFKYGFLNINEKKKLLIDVEVGLFKMLNK
jgi:adenosine deaminase